MRSSTRGGLTATTAPTIVAENTSASHTNPSWAAMGTSSLSDKQIGADRNPTPQELAVNQLTIALPQVQGIRSSVLNLRASSRTIRPYADWRWLLPRSKL